MPKKKAKSEVPQEQGAKDVALAGAETAPPALETRKVAWVIVYFSNGDSFKVASKVIARDYVDHMKGSKNDYKKLFEVVMRDPNTLYRWASEMTWNQIAPHAIRNERVTADYAAEWKGVRKDHTFEEPEREPRPAPQEQRTAAEDLEKQKPGKVKDPYAEEDEDEETFEDA